MWDPGIAKAHHLRVMVIHSFVKDDFSMGLDQEDHLQKNKPHWLNASRFFAYPRLVLAVILIVATAWVCLSNNLVDRKGKPLGYDFITFWAASHLALQHHAQDAYNLNLIFKAENLAVPASKGIFVWYYPPSFFLLILPLALMPYMTAYVVFMLSTLTLYVAVFRSSVSHHSAALWGLASFAGLWMNFFHGQNAFLTAAIAACALINIERRPTLAGVLIGLLAIKPHLALLFPVGLIAIRAWRALMVASVTAFVFVGFGTVVLGPETLKACLKSLGYARIFLEGGFLPWSKMPTVFAFLRILHVPVRASYAGHAFVACFAAYCVWSVWRRSSDRELRASALMVATFLISPYVFDYDLAWLAFPIGWLALSGIRCGWLSGEREILVAAWILPLLMSPVAQGTFIQTGPLLLGAFLWAIVRRSKVELALTETMAIQPVLDYAGA